MVQQQPQCAAGWGLDAQRLVGLRGLGCTSRVAAPGASVADVPGAPATTAVPRAGRWIWATGRTAK